VIQHYEMAGDHLKKTKGYETYAAMQDHVNKGVEDVVRFFMSLQVWGTPEKCFETIKSFTQRTGAGAYTGVFSYGGMPHAEAERSLRLFAREVLPQVRKLPGAPLLAREAPLRAAAG
jgi:hypothetical protein